MGYSSQSGQVVFRTQAVQGTYQADTPTAGVAMKLRSGSLGPSRELMIPDPEIGGGRDIADAQLGPGSWSGDYEFYGRTDGLATLAYAAFGLKATSTTTGISTHTITPSDLALLPFLSIEESIGNTLECYQYTDAVVNTLHLECDANGYIMGTAGLIARTQSAGNTRSASPLADNTPLMVGSSVTITYNGVTVPAKSFSLDLNNNFEDDDFRLGSFFIGDLTPKRREVTASFHIRETSSALWRQAVYGVSSATAPGGVTTKQALVISFQTYDFISGGTPANTPASVTITIPKFSLKPYSLAASADDVIESDLEGEALRPAVGTPLATMVIKTGLALIA